MQALVKKAFKTSLGLSLFPLAFVSVFGTLMVYAWTGETDPSFRVSFWLLSLKSLFASMSLLCLVLYRVSGKALLDNVRQALRVVLILGVMGLAPKLGFSGVLGGIAVVELIGLLFMIFALTRSYHLFRAVSLLPDATRMTTAVALILLVGAIASYVPVPGGLEGRLLAILKLIEVFTACLLVAWPLAVRTRAITPEDRVALVSSLFPSRKHRDSALERGAEA